jgi:hypothetical protein
MQGKEERRAILKYTMHTSPVGRGKGRRRGKGKEQGGGGGREGRGSRRREGEGTFFHVLLCVLCVWWTGCKEMRHGWMGMCVCAFEGRGKKEGTS